MYLPFLKTIWLQPESGAEIIAESPVFLYRSFLLGYNLNQYGFSAGFAGPIGRNPIYR